MKRESHFLPPRSAVIFWHTQDMLAKSALCVRKFAMRVAEQYMELTAPHQRQAKFRWGVSLDDLARAEVHNAQILSRYMDGTVKVLPADLEDAWVLSLPQPWRGDCERDLARRRGRMSFEWSEDLSALEHAAIGEVLTQAGELCSAWGQSLADGHLTPAEAQRINNESDDVITAVLRLRRLVAETSANAAQPAGRGVSAGVIR